MKLLLLLVLGGHLYMLSEFTPRIGGEYAVAQPLSGEELEPVDGAELVFQGAFA